ncbi:iron complex transport system permease protein [Anoxybacillus caldiproteolyticus]|uniref:Iron complex transport system permease protein n=2 Tax=Thermaerobacillus caldiproteolyticus TaxID=247480 RepID=A0A7V9Z707_9BACL|nr:iron ABC transporter permease [Anoxybacillus caldiproteolyticus]MBA2875252.1 iron complex transport system permease protein [Anoxybacillus caldiproteolyticus]
MKNDTVNQHSRTWVAMMVLVVGVLAIVFGIALSISVGAANIHLSTVWEAIVHYNSNQTEHAIIRDLRLPRALADVLVGASFAVAGAIMQGMTRNPLADAGLLGLNAGSALMVAVCFAFLPGLSYNSLILFSFLGAAVAAGLVYGISSLARGGLTPVRLVLAGAAVSALLTALSEGIAIHFQLSQELAFWYAGGVAGVKWSQLKVMTPWLVIALVGALLLSRSITLLSLGDEVATGLGQKTVLVKMVGTIIVLLLAGVSVSAVGPIGFVGLVVPHFARFFVGVDYRWIIPCSAVIGGGFMIIADIGARMINPPYETPIGVLFALIGVPFFLYVSRKGRREIS